jgi:hypothetical protein
MDHWASLGYRSHAHKGGSICTSTASNPAWDVRACTTQTFRAIYREEGASGFFKGFVPNLLFLMGTYCAGIDEEAETGKPPL